MIGPIIGVIAANNDTPYVYFTTVLYPFLVVDTMEILPTVITRGAHWEDPNDDMTVITDIVSGALVESVIYVTYDEIEQMSITNDIHNGSLITTVAYIDYNIPIEEVTITNDILSGTLQITIEYITYDNWPTENMSIDSISIISGTLI
jgi:uncharacterized membrane protein